LIGPDAKKNVLELDSRQAEQWLLGQEPELADKQLIGAAGYVIVKHGKDYMGCGKIAGEKLMNFVPKTRRISSVVE
jgi:NOL1/NOP2/fmu family ribosome biogenesis protein